MSHPEPVGPVGPDTLNEALYAAAARGDRGGLRFLDRRERATEYDWALVLERSLEACGKLQAVGVAPGERVALVYATGAAFFDAFFGVLLAGAVPVPLYPPVRLGRLDEYHGRTARMLTLCDAVLVLAETRTRRVLGQAVGQAGPRLGCRTLDSLPEGSAAPVQVLPTDLCLVQFSSGTTVEPKPVALSHAAFAAQAKLTVHAIEHTWPEVDGLRHAGVSWLPLYHDMGLIGCVGPALWHPAWLTLIGPELFLARPAAWLRAISRFGATISPAPNFAYSLCVDRIKLEELDGVDLSGWRVAMNGAEPVAPETLRAFVQRFARWGLRPEALTPVYGLSEAALAVTFSSLHEPFTTARFDRTELAENTTAVPTEDGVELVSVGAPLPGFLLEVRDERGQALEAGRVGRVWARGPSLMTGYLGQPEATAKALCEGWLDTGDVGFLYQEQLYLTGRARDLLILRGRNHAPHEVEQVVDTLPGARTGCSAAVSHRREGQSSESLMLFVEHGGEASDAAIAELPELARGAVLRKTGLSCSEVVVLEPGTLPRTSSGKIRRGEALRRHLAGELAPPERVTVWTLARAMLRSRSAMPPSG